MIVFTSSSSRWSQPSSSSSSASSPNPFLHPPSSSHLRLLRRCSSSPLGCSIFFHDFSAVYSPFQAAVRAETAEMQLLRPALSKSTCNFCPSSALTAFSASDINDWILSVQSPRSCTNKFPHKPVFTPSSFYTNQFVHKPLLHKPTFYTTPVLVVEAK